MPRTFVHDNLTAPSGEIVCAAYTEAGTLIGSANGVLIAGAQYRATIAEVDDGDAGYVRWTDDGAAIAGGIEGFDKTMKYGSQTHTRGGESVTVEVAPAEA